MENEKITSETKEEIKKAIEELVLKMGFSCEVEIVCLD